jgi:hypothetical protein
MRTDARGAGLGGGNGFGSCATGEACFGGWDAAVEGGLVTVRVGERERRRRSLGAGVFGTVLKYANLPEVRAWRACAQLGLAGVFAVRKPESNLPVLLSEISTRQKARAVPASGVYVQSVFAAD